MTERDVKIVVAEGASGRKGLLRFVLESEGYNVVGEAATSADLAQALEAYHPDVVVMDDGIGATAVGMTHDLAPAAKVILVWPEAVVPIGGDAAVEPSSVLRQLGPTVERLTGAPSVTGRMGAREGAEAAGIGMLSLGAILAMGRAAASPSEPPVPLDASAALDPAEPVIDDRGATPVLILPPTADVGPDGADLPAAVAGPLTVAELEAAERRAAAPVPTVGAVAGIAAVTAGAATAGAGVAAVGGGGSGAALNRRLGTLALGGAALAGSLVLALALSGSRVPTGGVRGEAPTISSPPPVTSSPTIPPPQTVAVPGALLGDLGGSGTTLALVSTPVAPGSGSRTGNDNGGPRGGTGGNDGNTPTTPPAGTGGSGGGSGSVGSGGGGGGSGGAGDPGGSGGSGGSGSGGSGTGGGSGGSGGGGSFFGGGGGGGGGGKNGGGECVPVAHDGDGRTDGQPCATDDDELDGSHHGYGDGDHHGDGYQGDDDHQGDGDHDGDDCDGHDGASDHGHDGDDGDHEHDGGDGHGDGGDGHGDDGDGS